MENDRKILITGEISIESYGEFSKQLSLLEKGKGPVLVELASEGGLAVAALAYFDRIKASKNTINIDAYGFVASAAVLILAAGDYRRLSANGWVMVHEDSCSEFESINVSAIEKEAKRLRMLENQWAQILSGVTSMSKSAWAGTHKQERYLSPKQCLSIGLIESIIYPAL